MKKTTGNRGRVRADAKTQRKRAAALAAFMLASGAAAAAPSDEQKGAPVSGQQGTFAGTVQDVVVSTGTRETDKKAAQSLSPVDVIGAKGLQATGQQNLRDALIAISPAIARQEYAGDTAVLKDVLTLHGLSPDHVLVLVNGKRRHTSANISLDSGPQQGSTGVDIDTIPVGLVDHIEILRDGASAQYGSDAIAGVINIILKSDTHGGSIENATGQTYKGDGLRQSNSATAAIALGQNGFLDLSAEYDRRNHTVRTGLDDYFGAYPHGLYNPIEGDPSSTRETVGFNAGYFVSNDVELYGFGTYAHRNAAAYQNYRPPIVLPAVYPNGFSPQETVNENDYSFTVGAKGEHLFGWTWDLSSTYGGDYNGLGMVNSANSGLFAATGTTPTDFRLGSLESRQWTSNLDLSRPFRLPLLPAPVNVSVGLEQRHEAYQVGAGEPASYLDGGAQALPGFAPVSASNNSRDVLGTYIDLSTKLTPKWQVELAGRYEHYSDVGDTTNGKISTRYDFTPRIAVRGSVSTGFRAPSLAEEYFTNLNVSPASAQGLLAANSNAARLIGAAPLRPEASTNYNLGLVLNPVHDLNVTIDAYQINIRNRIVIGGTASGAAAIAAMSAAGIAIPSTVPASAVSASYFTNGASTRTSGIDVTGTYHSSFGRWGRVDWDLGVNLNNTSVTGIAPGQNGRPALNAQQVAWLSTSTPKNKIIVGGTWHLDQWAVSLHETRYGPTTTQATYFTGPNAFSTTNFLEFHNAPKYITDLEVRYDVNRHLQVALGANNLFDAYPSKLPAIAQLEGFQYDAYGSQIGTNGGFYYLRARYQF